MDASTTRLQRFLRACVPCLLTANAFALVILATDDPEPMPAEQGTRTVTLIQGADGSTREVDPSTPEGQAAIEEAEREGATITETTVPTATTLPGATTTTVKGALPPKATTSPTLPGADEVIDDAQDTVNDLIDRTQTTIRTITTTPVDDDVDQIVDDLQDTVDETVDEVQDTVSTLPLPVTTTTTKAPTTTTTNPVQTVVTTVTDSVGGLLGG